jgi:NAD(P)-dependent dehydrogenase (short-subunit alcohol dehydrogenase family)
MPVALITGASLGLGRALATELAGRGWTLVVDGRRAHLLDDLVRELPPASVTALPGDVADPAHRAGLLEAVQRHGRLDLLANNASTLGLTLK